MSKEFGSEKPVGCSMDLDELDNMSEEEIIELEHRCGNNIEIIVNESDDNIEIKDVDYINYGRFGNIVELQKKFFEFIQKILTGRLFLQKEDEDEDEGRIGIPEFPGQMPIKIPGPIQAMPHFNMFSIEKGNLVKDDIKIVQAFTSQLNKEEEGDEKNYRRYMRNARSINRYASKIFLKTTQHRTPSIYGGLVLHMQDENLLKKLYRVLPNLLNILDSEVSDLFMKDEFDFLLYTVDKDKPIFNHPVYKVVILAIYIRIPKGFKLYREMRWMNDSSKGWHEIYSSTWEKLNNIYFTKKE